MSDHVAPTPRLLAVPGLGLGGESWTPTLSRLPGGRTSEVRCLPGYGRPAEPGTDLSPRALAEQLLARLADGRWVLAGHSASCQVVAHAAALRPDLVAGLLLVGPTTDPRAATWTRLAGRWLATAAHEDPRQVPGLVRQYRRTGLVTMARAMEAARRDDLVHTLRGVSCPVHVVRGRHDAICPADWADVVGTSGRARAVVETLPVGAHMVPQTAGDLVARAVARAVDGAGAGAPSRAARGLAADR